MSTSVVLVLAGCGGGAGWGDGTFDEASQSALGSACAEGQTACADGCTDTSSDGTNCGSCGNNCGSDACCEGVCVNLEQDATNCGACGAVCSTAGSCYDGSCSAGSEIVCDGGSCTSPGSKPEKGSLGIDIGTPLGTVIVSGSNGQTNVTSYYGTPWFGYSSDGSYYASVTTSIGSVMVNYYPDTGAVTDTVTLGGAATGLTYITDPTTIINGTPTDNGCGDGCTSLPPDSTLAAPTTPEGQWAGSFGDDEGVTAATSANTAAGDSTSGDTGGSSGTGTGGSSGTGTGGSSGTGTGGSGTGGSAGTGTGGSGTGTGGSSGTGTGGSNGTDTGGSSGTASGGGSSGGGSSGGSSGGDKPHRPRHTIRVYVPRVG